MPARKPEECDLLMTKAIQSGDLSTNILLAEGDIIYVPPTLWARVGHAINAMLYPFQPFLGFGTSVAGSAVANAF